MDWLNGYKNTTLAFWLDKDEVSFEQLAAFIALIAGSIYILFLGEYGEGTPRVEPKKYIFIIFGIYIFMFYITGGAKWLYSKNIAKFIRLTLLHIVLSLLFLAVQTSLNLGVGVTIDCTISSIVAGGLLYLHTVRTHNQHNKKPVALSAMFVMVLGFLSNYYLILPWQGSV